RDGTAGNRDDTPPTVAQGETFAPLVITLPDALDLSKATFRIEYEGSNPAGVTTSGTGAALTYNPAPGFLRVWTKDGNQARDGRSFFAAGATGDYVAPTPAGAQYGPADLARPRFTASPRTVTLYMQGIRPSAKAGDHKVSVKIDPDGSGPAGLMLGDSVGTTLVGMEFINSSNDPYSFLSIGHWGADSGSGVDGYDGSGNVRNSATDTFIDRDPERFYARIVDPSRNTDPAVAERFTIQVGTVLGNGSVDDDLTDIVVVETGPDTGIFVSKSMLLTTH